MDDNFPNILDHERRSPTRLQIVQESIAANRSLFEKGKRRSVWTKQPKYEGLQFVLDSKNNMKELKPNKYPTHDQPTFQLSTTNSNNDDENDGLGHLSDEALTAVFSGVSEHPQYDPLHADGHDPLLAELDRILRELKVPSACCEPVSDEENPGWSSEAFLNEEDLAKEAQDASSISLENLVDEVRSIYTELVLAEKRVIDMEGEQIRICESLTVGQWRTLGSLHRNLLDEHHDFLVATQHPVASPALRELARKYAMPTRMWHYGIDTLLRVLQHRTGESQEQIQHLLKLASCALDQLVEDVPTMIDEWNKLKAAVDSFTQRLNRDLFGMSTSDSSSADVAMSSDAPSSTACLSTMGSLSLLPVSSTAYSTTHVAEGKGLGSRVSTEFCLPYESEDFGHTSRARTSDSEDLEFGEWYFDYYLPARGTQDEHEHTTWTDLARRWYRTVPGVQLPAHALHALCAWIYHGQNLSHDFNIYTKVFCLLSLVGKFGKTFSIFASLAATLFK